MKSMKSMKVLSCDRSKELHDVGAPAIEYDKERSYLILGKYLRMIYGKARPDQILYSYPVPKSVAYQVLACTIHHCSTWSNG